MRPGGLTALAIFNFVFGGLAVILTLLGFALAGRQIESTQRVALMLGETPPSAALIYFMLGLDAIRGGLLIMSGVGYLGMRRFTGRIIGNSYAVLAFVGIILEATLLPSFFTAFNLTQFVYPIITLLLLNIIFKKDFVR